MINDYFYLFALLIIIALIALFSYRNKNVTVSSNQDRVYWRPEGNSSVMSFRVGKIVYLPDSVMVVDSDDNEVFRSSTASVSVTGGNYMRGGWVLSSNEATTGVYILMRPYGNPAFFSPFAERKAEQRLLQKLGKQ